jgi:hypothetical protein
MQGKPITRFIDDNIVLKEVIEVLSASRSSADVICSPADRSSVHDVREFLNKVGVEITGDAGRWIFAKIKNTKEALKIEKEHKKQKRCIKHFWLDKHMTH